MSEPTTNVAALLPAIASDLVVQERQIPSPGSDEVLIHNHTIAINPVDWKRQAWGFMISSYPTILGADVCGTVVKVGPSVTAFRPGDRVLGLADSFSSGNIDHAAFQTYTILKAISTTKLPQTLSFADGATLPTAVGTAAMALFDALSLPRPIKEMKPQVNDTAAYSSALLVWGGASSVGSMVIQFAHMMGFTVLATASPQHHDHLRSLGASTVVDYRSPMAVDDLVAAAKRTGHQIVYAIDAVSTAQTLASIMQVLSSSHGIARKLGHVVPWPEDLPVPEGIETRQVACEELWGRRVDLSAWLYNEVLPTWLDQGAIVPSRYRVVDGGLSGLQNALNELKKGVSGEKLLIGV